MLWYNFYTIPINVYMSDIRNKMKEIIEEINKTNNIDELKSKVTEGFNEIISEIENINRSLENIQEELFIEDGYDFEIVCPYCNNEFTIEYDEEQVEVKCPECNNTIELNWSGDLEDEECSGSCSHCHGCNHDDENEDDEE